MDIKDLTVNQIEAILSDVRFYWDNKPGRKEFNPKKHFKTFEEWRDYYIKGIFEGYIVNEDDSSKLEFYLNNYK